MEYRRILLKEALVNKRYREALPSFGTRGRYIYGSPIKTTTINYIIY
jgi:hypothetical protein